MIAGIAKLKAGKIPVSLSKLSDIDHTIDRPNVSGAQ